MELGLVVLGLCFMTGRKSERLCRSENWATSPAKWDKCPIKSNTVPCWIPEGFESRQGKTRNKRRNRKKSLSSVWMTACNCIRVCLEAESTHLYGYGDLPLIHVHLRASTWTWLRTGDSLKSPLHRGQPRKCLGLSRVPCRSSNIYESSPFLTPESYLKSHQLHHSHLNMEDGALNTWMSVSALPFARASEMKFTRELQFKCQCDPEIEFQGPYNCCCEIDFFY